MVSVDEREEKIQQALSIIRHRNFERYGIDNVDEQYVRSLNDRLLDHVIDRDRVLRERGL